MKLSASYIFISMVALEAVQSFGKQFGNMYKESYQY